jgi:hypothetical protein
VEKAEMKQEQQPRWRKSTMSASSNCVEVASVDGSILVRDTKDRKATLTFTADEWQAFLDGASDGQFSLQRLQSEQ